MARSWALAWSVQIEAELGQNVVVGDAFATGKRGAGGGDLAGFFRADRLIVEGRVGQGAGERIEHDLQEADDGGDLTGSHRIDQFMGLLLRAGCG